MTWISGGKVFDRCTRCNKVVQMNGVFGGIHLCVTDCQLAGRHLDVHEEDRGIFWSKKILVCKACGKEEKK